MNKISKQSVAKVSIWLALILCLCAGCAAEQEQKYTEQEQKYTREELNNLAEIRVYTAGAEEPIKTVTDEEQLYQFNQCAAFQEDITEEYGNEEHQKEIKKTPEEAGAQYHLVAYRYPAARFGKKELEKFITLTLYEDSNIVKIAVAEESIKAFPLPEEFLTFYYEVSAEDMEFCRSLAEE